MKSKVKDILIISAIAVLAVIAVLAIMKNGGKNSADMIVAVHIKGEVKNPGYYELDYGKRVKDAIEKAGGTTKKAELEEINLAAKLRDGDEIIIPAIGETPSESVNEYAVNINTADLNLLCTLEGIGADTAKAIIAYRTNCGGFDKVEDLKKVDGIGDAKFNAIKDKITV